MRHEDGMCPSFLVTVQMSANGTVAHSPVNKERQCVHTHPYHHILLGTDSEYLTRPRKLIYSILLHYLAYNNSSPNDFSMTSASQSLQHINATAETAGALAPASIVRLQSKLHRCFAQNNAPNIRPCLASAHSLLQRSSAV
jgi:hypothetical protein